MLSKSLRAVLVVALLPVAPSFARTPTVGFVVDAACGDVQTLAERGEVYAIKVPRAPTTRPWTDWQVHAASKGGPLVRMADADVDEDALQVLGGNFAEAAASTDVVFVFTTFPGGGLHVDSGSFADDYNYIGGGVRQQVGDSPLERAGSGGVVLPDGPGPYTANLGEGPESFPRLLGGWPEVALAPVVELDVLTGERDPTHCGYGGAAARPGGERGLIIGYNVFRTPASDGPTAPLSSRAAFDAWIDFVSVDPAGDPDGGLARLSDPDGWPSTGDEVLVYRDSPTLPDGRPRVRGTAPAPGETHVYRFQPVLEGAVGDFSEVFLGQRELDRGDARADLDGDGVHDAVDYDGPASEGGPEFLSPQVQAGLEGLGLTHAGRPLLSKAVVVAAGTAPERRREDGHRRPERSRRR